MPEPIENNSTIFTEDQVDSLNAYQNCGMWHPFTCSNGCGLSLLAKCDGWECPGGCGYGQGWAHQFMMDWSWKTMLVPKAKKRMEAIHA